MAAVAAVPRWERAAGRLGWGPGAPVSGGQVPQPAPRGGRGAAGGGRGRSGWGPGAPVSGGQVPQPRGEGAWGCELGSQSPGIRWSGSPTPSPDFPDGFTASRGRGACVGLRVGESEPRYPVVRFPNRAVKVRGAAGWVPGAPVSGGQVPQPRARGRVVPPRTVAAGGRNVRLGSPDHGKWSGRSFSYSTTSPAAVFARTHSTAAARSGTVTGAAPVTDR